MSAIADTRTPELSAKEAGAARRAAATAAAAAPELSAEQVQELLMLSSFSAAQLRVLWRQFVGFGGDATAQTLRDDQFLAIPSIAANPLRHRLVLCFAFEDALDGTRLITFNDFIAGMSVFSHHGDKKMKLHFAFRMQDFNNDGKICKDDLLLYLQTVSDFGPVTTL